MDILTHIISGLAAGTVVAGVSRRGFKQKAAIVAISGLGGALPDIDAASLWSGFDATIGQLFHLPFPGSDIYSGKLWYSHHGFFHSLAAALLFAAMIGAIAYVLHTPFKRICFRDFFKSYGVQRFLLTGFLAGYMMHLLGDIPTPASTWGGIRLFYPFGQYIGGTGQIWWWNNYDIFLIACGVFAVNAALLSANLRVYPHLNKAIAVIFALGLTLSIVQINTRDIDFAYTGHTSRYQEFEIASKAQQKKILGDRLYRTMEKFDDRLPVYF